MSRDIDNASPRALEQMTAPLFRLVGAQRTSYCEEGKKTQLVTDDRPRPKTTFCQLG